MLPPTPGRLDFEHAVLADGAARNVGTGLLVDRQALAGQHRLIHRGLAGQDGSIDWDAGAGLDDDGVFDPDIFGGDLHLLALLVEDDGGVGDHRDQRVDRLLGGILTVFFQIFAQQHQRDDHRG